MDRLRLVFARLWARGSVHVGPNAKLDSGVRFDARKGGRIKIGRNFKVKTGAIINARHGSVEIGDNCSLNPYSILYGAGHGLRIGDNVRIAAHCVVIPINHGISRSDIPIKDQEPVSHGIRIEDDVWIGANCTNLDGAHIRTGCVVGAGAVLRGDTVPGGVYGGVPAKLLRMRDGT